MKKSVRILALDLEGTLISNAVSQFPRPGLFQFLEEVDTLFEEVVFYTAVRTEAAKQVMANLVGLEEAPQWVKQVRIIDWDRVGEKDLELVSDDIEEVWMVDNHVEVYAKPGQRHRWIPIPSWDYRTESGGLDQALENLLNDLRNRLE